MLAATSNPDRVEAPVTARAYFLCVFASFGGIFFGYDTGWMGGVLGKLNLQSAKGNKKGSRLKYPQPCPTSSRFTPVSIKPLPPKTVSSFPLQPSLS